MKRLISFLLVFSTLFVLQAPPTMARSRTNSGSSPLMQDVRSAVRQAEARFDSGNVSGAADLARRILEKYPSNAEAQALLDKCIAAEKAEYDAAIASLNTSKLADFKQKYPSSSYVDDVSRRIEDLPYWLPAKEANTVEGYRKYLAESTHLLYKQEADDAIKEISVKQAYDAAAATNTIQAYKDFIKEFPDSKYEKDASNKIARLLADAFNSTSTYEEKATALAYAKNEMTRDYVNNKFNKATAKKTTTNYSHPIVLPPSASEHSSTKSSSNYRRRSSGGSFKEAEVYFGLQPFIDYSGSSYVLGFGLEMRVGTPKRMFNLLLGAKLGWASYRYTYQNKEYYGSESWAYYYNDVEGTGKTTNVLLPIVLNWNFFRDDSVCWYLGAGYQFGCPISGDERLGQQSHAIILQTGLGFRHFDIRLSYIDYQTRLFVDSAANKSYLGFSMTYYF